jgi:hypothetical protein
MSLMLAQKPETFLLSQEQQDNLPPASREALEQVDQRMLRQYPCLIPNSQILSRHGAVKLAT